MEELYRSYLTFLRSMSQGLERLTDLAEKKYVAAQTDDLLTLNDLLNQEQAQSLNFRGLELTRDKLLPKLGLTNVPLSGGPVRGLPEGVRQGPDAAGAEPAGSGPRHRPDGRPPGRERGRTRIPEGSGGRSAPVHEDGLPRLIGRADFYK